LLHHADRRERGSGRSLAQKAGVHDGGQAVEEAVESASQQLALEVRQDSLWWNKPIVLDTIGGENVIAYNYVDQAIIMGTRWQENALDGAHQTFSHFDLFEGNWAPNVGSDSTHGNAGWMTFFRNYTSGRNSFSYNIGESQPGRPNQNLRAAGVDAWNREHTFVGNVFNTVDVGQVWSTRPRPERTRPGRLSTAWETMAPAPAESGTTGQPHRWSFGTVTGTT